MKRNGHQAASGYSVSQELRAEWATATDNKDGTATVKVAANEIPDQRTAKVAVTGDSGEPAIVSITQAGASEAV